MMKLVATEMINIVSIMEPTPEVVTGRLVEEPAETAKFAIIILIYGPIGELTFFRAELLQAQLKVFRPFSQ